VVLVQEWVHERFWVVPTVLLIGGVVAGLAISMVDSVPGLAELGAGLPVKATTAEALLGIIAASMLTYVAAVSRSPWWRCSWRAHSSRLA
jgi:uncharacterized membrane protein